MRTHEICCAVSSLIQTVLSAPESSPDRLGFAAQFAGFTAGRELHPSPKKLQVAAAIIHIPMPDVNHSPLRPGQKSAR